MTGSVYNSDTKSPYLPLNASQSGIKTRSTLKGTSDNFDEIRFEEKKGGEQFFMQAEKDHTINVKNNRAATVGAADSISVGASRSASVTKDLTTTVGTGGAAQSKLTVTGKHNVDVSDTIEITAVTHIKLTVGTSTIMKTPTFIELVSGGKSLIKLDTNAFAKSSGGSTVLLDTNATMTANGKAQVLLDANALMTSSGNSKVLLDGDATMDSASGTANVTAAVKVALAGANSGKMDLEASGCAVAGPQVSVSGASLTQVSGAVVKIN